jgi:hypothetical protein
MGKLSVVAQDKHSVSIKGWLKNGDTLRISQKIQRCQIVRLHTIIPNSVELVICTGITTIQKYKKFAITPKNHQSAPIADNNIPFIRFQSRTSGKTGGLNCEPLKAVFKTTDRLKAVGK